MIALLMRTWAVATCLLVFSAAALPRRPHPVAARIVDVRGAPPEQDRYGNRVGNVEVTLSNSHKEVWTHSGRCELPKVSKSGLVGWTYAAGRHSRGAWMNAELCIARTRRDIARFTVDRAFIERWDFSDNDTCVVTVSRNIHGPSWIEKLRIDNGEVVDSCSGSNDTDKTPEWARPYLDDD
ncbi:MAG: hypothetical protein ABR611_13765 [Chthoniobacterales bacterium]